MQLMIANMTSEAEEKASVGFCQHLVGSVLSLQLFSEYHDRFEVVFFLCEKDCDKQLDFYDFSYDFYFFSVLLGRESGIISRFCFGKKPLTSKTGWAVSGSSRGFNSHIALLEEKKRIFRIARWWGRWCEEFN